MVLWGAIAPTNKHLCGNVGVHKTYKGSRRFDSLNFSRVNLRLQVRRDNKTRKRREFRCQ